jgi:polyisoprenoid-binding protein YceI
VPSFGPDQATCEVLTFKEGLLSPVAHDLILRVTSFRIVLDPAAPAVTAEFDASSLRVITALRGGQPLPGALRPADAKEIETIIARDVLRASRFPVIRFVSTAAARTEAGYEVAGRLTLAGATRALDLRARRDDGRLTAEARVRQPDYGIRPYRAMLGTLRVQPEVLVRVTIPEEPNPAHHGSGSARPPPARGLP